MLKKIIELYIRVFFLANNGHLTSFVAATRRRSFVENLSVSSKYLRSKSVESAAKYRSSPYRYRGDIRGDIRSKFKLKRRRNRKKFSVKIVSLHKNSKSKWRRLLVQSKDATKIALV